MSTLIDAAASVRKVAALFKDFTAAADALERVGSLEQAEAEAGKRVVVAQEQAQEAQEQLAVVREANSKALAVAEAALRDAEQAGALEREKARLVAAEIIDEAKRKAEGLTTAAERGLEEKARASAAQLARAQEQLNGVRAEQRTAQHDLAAAQQELAAVEQRLSEARAAARALLQG